MESLGYWERVRQSRLSRRRALAATAAVGGAAIVLSACGGGDEGPSAPKDASGLLSFPEDTTSQARSGGTYRSFLPSDVPSMDPLSSNSVFTQAYIAFATYPRLLKFAYTKHPDTPTGELEGDSRLVVGNVG